MKCDVRGGSDRTWMEHGAGVEVEQELKMPQGSESVTGGKNDAISRDRKCNPEGKSSRFEKGDDLLREYKVQT